MGGFDTFRYHLNFKIGAGIQVNFKCAFKCIQKVFECHARLILFDQTECNLNYSQPSFTKYVIEKLCKHAFTNWNLNIINIL